jgi:hypothetical protein
VTVVGATGHTTRSFPFSPRSARQLECGDLIAVPCEPSGWACLQVVDLQRRGPGARTTLIVGVLPWRGEQPPTSEAVTGVAATEQGMTRIELFTEGGLQVVATTNVIPTGRPSNYRDFEVGATHHVWGWRAAIRTAQEAAAAV